MALGDFRVPSGALRQAVSWLLAICEANMYGRKAAREAEHSQCPASSLRAAYACTEGSVWVQSSAHVAASLGQ